MSHTLDFETVEDVYGLFRQFESVSSELVLDRLLGKVMELVLGTVGAERGALLVEQDGKLFVRVLGSPGGVSLQRLPFEGAEQLPRTAIEHALRTGEAIVLADAVGDARFASDPYVATQGVRALLVLPLRRSGGTVGVLTLESTGAAPFKPGRVRALEHLSSQIAISLENGVLFERVSTEAHERRRAEEAVRFVADASATLAESLDYQATLGKVARLAVPWLADWCTVDILDDTGRMRRVAAAHRDPAAEQVLHEIRDRQEQWGSPHTSVEVLMQARSLVFPEVTDAILERHVADPEVRRLVRKLGLNSGMAVPLRARGRPLGAMTFSSNKPGRRYGPSDLTVADDLARRAAVAIDNARLYRDAQEAIRMRDEFLSVASHELNTPLTALQVLLEGAERTAARVSPQVLEKTLGIMGRQTRRLSALINELLTAAQIQGGFLPLHIVPVDLVALVRDVEDRLADELTRVGCVLTVRAPAQLSGHWDRLRLEQIVTNLLSNAIKFGPGKPIEVSVQELPYDVVQLVVEDHGIGIPPERLPHIFGRFERAVSTSHYGGLGLGLYIVQEIVRALGGSVRAESVVGQGAKFTVELARTRPPAFESA